MHAVSRSELQQLALDFLREREDSEDAWSLFRDEARLRYSAEDDGGDLADYYKGVVEIFEAAKFTHMDECGTIPDQIVVDGGTALH
jgi:hypothetical protein